LVLIRVYSIVIKTDMCFYFFHFVLSCYRAFGVFGAYSNFKFKIPFSEQQTTSNE